ncbi:MAG TPA: hypothetical protein VJ305_07690 [Streptosporangiaceae bacterium]|nr:hypothetical protein [Streptosporangiaceae bacterium]
MLAITAELGQFRGEPVHDLGLQVRHPRGVGQNRTALLASPGGVLDAEDRDRLPGRFGFEPARQSEWRDLLTALRRAVDTELIPGSEIFVAIVVNGVPLDALVVRLGSNCNAIYTMIFGARRKLRTALAADGCLDHNAARRS